MPALQIENLGDLLTVTLADRPEPNYTDLGTALVDAPAAKQLLDDAVKTVQSGKTVNWPIRVNNGDGAENIALTDHDNVNIKDGFVEASTNWRESTTKYAFYEEEMLVNRKPRQIVDLIKAREDGAMAEWIELMENNFWGFPSASDSRTPLGLPYWCTKNASTGFNGGIPTGYSSVAGVSPTTYSRWNNYTAQYTNVTLGDLISKLRVGAEKTKFKPLVKTPSTNTGDRLGYFTNLTVQQKFADVADSRNDNLGPDVAKMDGKAQFRGAVVEYIPKLDDDTTDPIYQLNWGVLKCVRMSGKWKKRRVLSPYPGQRNVVAVFIDSMYQFVCFNRRLLAVFATGTTYP